MPPHRKLLAAILVSLLLASGCKETVKTLGELQVLHNELTKKFGDTVFVRVNEAAYPILSITFINSALNNKGPQDRQQRAQEAAQIVKANYTRIKSLREIWVVFVRQQSRFVIFHYSESIDGYGFDNEGHLLPASNEDQPAATSGARATYRYLPSTNESDFSAEGLQLEGEPGGDKGLVVLPHFQVKGQAGVEKVPPPKEVSFDFASYSDKTEFEQTTPVVFLADDRPVFKANATFTGDHTQFCYLKVPYATFRRMIAASTLTIRLGAKEYALTPKQFEALRNMNQYVQDDPSLR